MARKIAQVGAFSIIFILFLTASAFAKPVVPGGESIGISMNLSGLLVTGVDKDSIADISGLKKGDLIEDFTDTNELLSKTRKGYDLKVLRSGKEKDIDIPTYADGFGADLKNTISGIGTLTYIDVQTNQIFAIGHKVTDIEDNLDLPTTSGFIFTSKIMGIERGDKTSELEGTFSASASPIGEVFSNDDNGVLAKDLMEKDNSKVMETGEPTIGPATIRTTISGNTVQEFNIEIDNVASNDQDKNISIKVTDSTLLNETGGIAAGMSGAPIIQGDKLVGVVTHVSAGDAQFGYGRTIEGN